MAIQPGSLVISTGMVTVYMMGSQVPGCVLIVVRVSVKSER